MAIVDLTKEEKLALLGTEYRQAKARFWSSLLPGVLFWPLLFFAVVAWNRMSNASLQARLLGVTDDGWTIAPPETEEEA